MTVDISKHVWLGRMLIQNAQLNFSAHIGFLFPELPFRERFAAARGADFNAVEHPSPFQTSATDVASLLAENNLAFIQTGFPAGDPQKGEKGFAALRERRADFRGVIHQTLDYARSIGCGMVHAMAGVIPPGASREAMWHEYLENLSHAADAAREYGIDIIVEPIGPGSIANYFIDRPQMAVDAIVAVNRPNVRLLFDVFHSISVGTEPLAFIRQHHALMGHVQIADYPGRHQPGTAVVDFERVFLMLQEYGYSGHIGCEYHPSGTTMQSFGWMESWKQHSHPV